MLVPFNVRDFLDRAEVAYPDQIALVDEPDQPAEPWPALTFTELADRARFQAAGLDRLGVGVGERVAIVSPNAARLLTSFFGVCGFGRILVPINFRLAADEVEYIVEHAEASVLLVDPELDEVLSAVTAPHRFVLGHDTDEVLFPPGAEPAPWEADEAATATINYTSGTTARPKGVQLTHRNCWINATVFGWHIGISDRDRYLHTLPMFHANGWGMPWATAAMGCPQIVLRKVDGAEVLRRVSTHEISLLCAAPAVVNAVLEAAPSWDGPVPGRGRTRVVVAGAPPPSRTIERIEEELGWEFVQIYGLTETAPLLTVNRRRAEWDDVSAGERARRLMRAGAPAVGTTYELMSTARCWPAATPSWRGTGASTRSRPAPSMRAGFAPVTAASSTRKATSPSSTARRTSSSPEVRTSPRSRWRTPSSHSTGLPKWPSSGSPTTRGVRWSSPSWSETVSRR